MNIAIITLSGAFVLLLFFFVWRELSNSRERSDLLDRLMCRTANEYYAHKQTEQIIRAAPKHKEEQLPRRKNAATVEVTENEVDVCAAQAAFKSIVGE
jgi:hypothetical protein